jgi:hypothetical protein
VSRSLVARNSASVPSHRRGLTRKEKVLANARSRFHEVGVVYAKKHGEAKAKKLVANFERASVDYAFGCLFLFGVNPLDWQTRYHTDGLGRYRLCIGRTPNGGGKTTGYALDEMYEGFQRLYADPLWGQYRMFHFAPVEAQALETKTKIDEILEGRSREQAYIDDNGEPQFRTCIASRWIEAIKVNGHEGFSFFNDSAILEFAPTAFMGKAKDGTDPKSIRLDEARHEINLTYLIDRMWLPRFLRVPGGRLDIRYTGLDASPELEYLKDRALRMMKRLGTRSPWYAYVSKGELRELNPTIRQEDVDLVEEGVSNKYVLRQILRGEDIQPAGAKFNLGAVKAAFNTEDEPAWLSRLTGLRKRVEARCERCRKQEDGHPEGHLMIGALDPASSAVDGDSIVFTAWDLDGPKVACEVVYLYEVERTGEKDGPETIQKVADHMEDLSEEINGPVGYDRKSALGHALKDLLVDVGGEIMEIHWDSREAKVEDLDLLKHLIDRGQWACPFQPKMNSQLKIYTSINDKKIAQDFVMVQVVAARVAWPYLPDFVTDPETLKEIARAQREATQYDGGTEWGPHADFGFSEMPDGLGAASGSRVEEAPTRVRTPLRAPSPAAVRDRSDPMAPQRGIARGN